MQGGSSVLSTPGSSRSTWCVRLPGSSTATRKGCRSVTSARHALNLAVDRDRLVREAMFGWAAPLAGLTPPDGAHPSAAVPEAPLALPA